MTVEKKDIRYLDIEAIELLYGILHELAQHQGEPIPVFREGLSHSGMLEGILVTPQTAFFGVEQFDTLAEKASVLWYLFIKNHIFVNGNKRMSVLVTLVFLGMNGKDLDIGREELTAKALEIVNSEASGHKEVKEELAIWINERLVDR